MVGPLRPLRGDADDRSRRDDRERCAAVDPGGPWLRAERPRLGRERLSDRLRRSVVAVRPDRRPDRSAADLPHRTRGVHRRVAALRDRAEPGPADRRPLRPGGRRRAYLRGDPGDDRDDVPGAARAGEGDRDLHLCRRRRRLDRAAGGRRAHRGDQLALDLLRQPPDRFRDGAVRAAARPRSRGDRPHRRGRPARRRVAHRRSDARRLHDPRGRRGGLGLDPDARARRRLDRADRRVRRSARRGSPTR